MIKNAFTDIVFGWERMSVSEKQERLQALENMVARFQNRSPRKIVIKKNGVFSSKNSSYRDAAAYYSRAEKENIYVGNLNVNAVEAIKNIVHEGFHAYIDDFISGEVESLKLYSQMNLEKFYIEEENLPAIMNEFIKRRMMPLFDSFYVEERVNYQENTIYMLKMILDSIESPYDAMRYSNTLLSVLDYAYDNEKRGKTYESRYGTTYDNVVIQALNKEFDEKCEISQNGRIVQVDDAEFIKFVNRAMRFYGEYSSAENSLFMTAEMSKKVQQNAAENILLTFNDYVRKMLRDKKKS